MKQLFLSGGATGSDEGLFVTVRDGHVEVTSASETLQLGRGETGFAAADGRTARPLDTPLFIQFDKVPLPNSPSPALLSVMGDVTRSTSNLCR